MVEARQRVDQFDANIPSEGVIVYQVQTSDPLGGAQNKTAPIELLTTPALRVGQLFTSPSGVTVQVKNSLAGGFSVRITSPGDPRCANILRQIAGIDDLLSDEKDLQLIKQLRAKRDQLSKQAEQLGCLKQ
jgi:hypothetical protein